MVFCCFFQICRPHHDSSCAAGLLPCRLQVHPHQTGAAHLCLCHAEGQREPILGWQRTSSQWTVHSEKTRDVARNVVHMTPDYRCRTHIMDNRRLELDTFPAASWRRPTLSRQLKLKCWPQWVNTSAHVIESKMAAPNYRSSSLWFYRNGTSTATETHQLPAAATLKLTLVKLDLH